MEDLKICEPVRNSQVISDQLIGKFTTSNSRDLTSPSSHLCHAIFVTLTGLQSPMRFKSPNCKRSQGAADARRRVRRRTFVLQVPDNKADAVPCERLPIFSFH